MNPTQDVVEQRVAALEGGVAALLVSSGQAATTLALLNIAEAGDHIVSSSSALRRHRTTCSSTPSPSSASRSRFVEDPHRPEAWRAAVRPNTKAFFGETIANPKAELLDIEAVAAVAHEVGVPLVVDNTIATPYLLRPLEWGADVVIHSATKYLGGHGTSIAGVIVDGGTFDYTAGPRAVPELQHPRRELPRAAVRPGPRRGQPVRREPLVHPQGAGAAAARPRVGDQPVQRLPHLAGAGDPQPARRAAHRERPAGRDLPRAAPAGGVGALGLPSTAARARRSPTSTSRAAPAPSSPSRSVAASRPGGRSSRGWSLHSHVANIGDVRSLAIHPASTTHSQGGDAEQARRRGHPRARPARGGHRDGRRHHRRPRPRLRGRARGPRARGLDLRARRLRRLEGTTARGRPALWKTRRPVGTVGLAWPP